MDHRDYGSNPLDGVWFQQAIERRAYAAVGDYHAPAQTVGCFMQGCPGAEWGKVEPTYAIGVKPCDFTKILPSFVTEQMKKGLAIFDRRIKDYAVSDAVLTAPETRTSSPVRILRGEDRQSISVEGIYPCGEGSGYAGGIMSSAVDGIHTRFRSRSTKGENSASSAACSPIAPESKVVSSSRSQRAQSSGVRPRSSTGGSTASWGSDSY